MVLRLQSNSKDSNDSVAAWVKNVHVPLVEVQVLFGYGNIVAVEKFHSHKKS